MGAAPYKQIHISGSDFYKSCPCPVGGPTGTQRCRNKPQCELARNATPPMKKEAEGLRSDILDSDIWWDLSLHRRKEMCDRLAELRVCSKDDKRFEEVGHLWMVQRYREEGCRVPTDKEIEQSEAYAKETLASQKKAAMLTPPQDYTFTANTEGAEETKPKIQVKSEEATTPSSRRKQAEAFWDTPPSTPPNHLAFIKTEDGVPAVESQRRCPLPSFTFRPSDLACGDPEALERQARKISGLEAEVNELRQQLVIAQKEGNKWRSKYEGLLRIFRAVSAEARSYCDRRDVCVEEWDGDDVGEHGFDGRN